MGVLPDRRPAEELRYAAQVDSDLCGTGLRREKRREGKRFGAPRVRARGGGDATLGCNITSARAQSANGKSRDRDSSFASADPANASHPCSATTTSAHRRSAPSAFPTTSLIVQIGSPDREPGPGASRWSWSGRRALEKVAIAQAERVPLLRNHLKESGLVRGDASRSIPRKAPIAGGAATLRLPIGADAPSLPVDQGAVFWLVPPLWFGSGPSGRALRSCLWLLDLWPYGFQPPWPT